MIVLEARGIKKSFAGVRALSEVNFKLHAGEVCGLIGANGSGKTTFARIVSGLLKPDGGELWLYKEKVSFRSRIDAERYRLAMVHQNLSLVPEMTIWENIVLGREQTGNFRLLDNSKAVAIAEKALESIASKLPARERVKNLSAVEKQVVEIAKALAKKPKILILDEPTASLDFQQVDSLFRAILNLKQLQVSTIFISHRLWEVVNICDRVAAFRNGETAGELDFANQPRNENLILPLITGSEAGKEPGKRSTSSVGMTIEHAAPTLEVQGLSLHRKLGNINFQLRKGEVLGLGGLQGQGQEEILMILAGYLGGYDGRIIVDGKAVPLLNTRNAIRHGIALIPGDRQKEGLFLEHGVMSNLLFPKIAMAPSLSFILPFVRFRRIVAEAISAISLVPPDPYLKVSQLSGGNQQKIVVGKWLAMGPKILLLSDPTKGVDVRARLSLYKIISRLVDAGTSVILYASDNQE
ncbi:MAG: sugar ABC transporter ATP-binding protein, partial [Verrucomicrobia bacterium]|nr:sugar ABC transporter ATP-binding protein [Verrucomicrobiota bacterium]